MKQGGFPKKTMSDMPLDGKTVLLRADYNVPMADLSVIHDDYRIKSGLATIESLLKRGCKVVICSHLGRPDGKRVKSLSLEPVAERLASLLKRPVMFVDDCVGDKVRVAVKNASFKSVILLENLRFYPGEEADNNSFAESLARDSQADYFVQDGFGVVHRAHASTRSVTQYLPSSAGLLLEKEYRAITHVMSNPKRPLVAVLGGAKISDKVKLVKRFVNIADKVIIGGAMANTFLRYRKYPVGQSMREKNLDDTIAEIYALVAKKVGQSHVDDFLVLPLDVAVSTEVNQTARRVEMDRRDVVNSEFILDIGTRTMNLIDSEMAGAQTVVWNGTLGMSELPQFAYGSARLALAMATNQELTSIIGGGDTADFVLNWDARNGQSFTHVSTGGGASLELMAGDPMPGIDALMDE